jgi:serpin B
LAYGAIKCTVALFVAGLVWGGVGTAGARGDARTYGAAVATGALGLDLMRAEPPGNLVVSPDSIAAALAMTGTGARGRTAAEIAQTLHLKGPSRFPRVGDLQGAILAGQAAAAAGDPEPPKLAIADGHFVQEGLSLMPRFLGGARRHFGAAPEAVDFSGDPEAALARINGWVGEHTEGLIPQILQTLPPATMLALANAVYLDADWVHPFEKSATRFDAFHGPGGRAKVEFMHETSVLGYGSGPGWRAVSLPYRSSDLSMIVVLPSRQRLGSLQHDLDGRDLTEIADGMHPRPVALSLPRFHLEVSLELGDVLEGLGMSTAFGRGADFSGMTGAPGLSIGTVTHAADLSVDEAGTVAAAATVVTMVRKHRKAPLEAVRFTADRPFLFFLRDDRTGAVLFAGRLVDPGSAAP